MIENIADIKWALTALASRTTEYGLTAAYYDGEQRLTFATEKFRNTFGRLFAELSVNHCPVCVDVPADRLQVEGFKAVNVEGDAQPVEEKAAEIWRRNRMNKRAGEVHQEALKTGDAYVVVDFVDNVATIHPNMAGRCAVKYDDENPGYIEKAAKWWTEEVQASKGQSRYRIRLNLYYRDRIEKYATKPVTTGSLPLTGAGFDQLEGDWNIPNPYKKVPVFHFANNADIGKCGKSELRDVIPVQDALNKSVCDMLVSMEFNAYPQRYVVGLEIETDTQGNPIPPFKSGVDRLMVVPPQKDVQGEPIKREDAQDVKFGEFSIGNLDGFIKVKESFRQDFSVISGVPAHYFMMASGGFPSGESLKTAEQRLTSKVADRQTSFGNVWEDVMRFCLEVEGRAGVQLDAKWKDTALHSIAEDIENVTAKRELGIPQRQAWAELGYTPQKMDEMEKQLEEEALANVRRSKMVVVPTVARTTQQVAA